MYCSRRTIPLPEGLPVGQLIGRKGSNIRHLQSKSASRIAVNDDADIVTVTGSASEISAAVNLLQAQFASWRSSGIAIACKLYACICAWSLDVTRLCERLKVSCLHFRNLCKPSNVVKRVAQTVQDCMSKFVQSCIKQVQKSLRSCLRAPASCRIQVHSERRCDHRFPTGVHGSHCRQVKLCLKYT